VYVSTILAVDDSATMRKCLEITFSGSEFNLVAVDTASAALEQVKMVSPDLVIADVSLEPDGYELCSTIKLASPSTPVLMLSSKQNPFDPGRGAHADDHIDKPFDTQVLQDKARELIRAAPKSDTDIPGKPAAPERISGKPLAIPDRAPPSSKIPAPRRKRPTPGMTPVVAQTAARRTVPFSMPSNLKKPAAGVGAGHLRQDEAAMMQRARPMAETHTLPGVSPMEAEAAELPPPTPQSALPQQHFQPQAPQHGPSSAPRQTQPHAMAPVAGAANAAAVGAVDNHALEPLVSATAGGGDGELGVKLAGLGLTKEQIDGVLALSRELIEQVVWDVVPTLAETLIKEEIKRLTEE
jgi:CheY-like chemotaxis protein